MVNEAYMRLVWGVEKCQGRLGGETVYNEEELGELENMEGGRRTGARDGWIDW